MISNSVYKAQLTIKAQQGDTFSRQFTFQYDDGSDTPVDLTDHELKLTVRNNAGTSILEWLNSDFTLISTGVYSIAKTATQMAAVAPGVYSFDLQVKYPTNESRTWIYGQFIIEQQTTT